MRSSRVASGSCWRGLARLVVKKWWGAVVFLLVLALAIPVMLQVGRCCPQPCRLAMHIGWGGGRSMEYEMNVVGT